MRIVVALLVIANVGLYLWASFYDRPIDQAPVPAARPPVAAEKMRLLSEPGARLIPRTEPAAAPGSEIGTAGRACYEIGPFVTTESVDQAAKQLQAWQVSATLRSEQQTIAPTLRVYLPPLASKQEAERKRQQLTQLGFRDHALIHDEGMENAISLGLFAVEANAQARIRQLRAKGIDAGVQVIPNLRTVYWFTLAGEASGDRVGQVARTQLMAHDWGSAVNVQPSACPAVAASPAPP